MASQGSEMMATDGGTDSATDIAPSNKSVGLRDGEVIETPNGKVKITSLNDDGSLNYRMEGTDGSVSEGRIASSSVDKMMAGGDEIKQKIFNNVAKAHHVDIDAL
jgi:predicted methyltransferase MtxX (methanogen marker protein 4)